MNAKQATKQGDNAQHEGGRDRNIVTYYCIQIEGKERFPYGLAGPLKTLEEAEAAKKWAVASLANQKRTDLEVIVWEARFFSGWIPEEWDERFKSALETSEKLQHATQERAAA